MTARRVQVEAAAESLEEKVARLELENRVMELELKNNMLSKRIEQMRAGRADVPASRVEL